MVVEIPQIQHTFDTRTNEPGWVAVSDRRDDRKLKPIIRCVCGRYVGLRLHHVHFDGTVTASFYHKRGQNYAAGENPDGCEWHVWLKLRGYDRGDFPAEE
jgi:hypothetical protein